MKDILGKGLIVQGTDDFTSQPSGNAGASSLLRD
jgi:Cu/Zn superoxide dismutase